MCACAFESTDLAEEWTMELSGKEQHAAITTLYHHFYHKFWEACHVCDAILDPFWLSWTDRAILGPFGVILFFKGDLIS